MTAQKKKSSSYRDLILLMLAGETIFLLPFVLVRIFRPTFLGAFDLTNMQLGNCFSIYGIVALFSYFFGGWLADRYSPAGLMGTALILTAAGGFYMATFPSYQGLLFLFGYWGFTTIFLFWAAMIKATRVWGGESSQGKAFGFLEAGRGLVASSIGIVSALIFAWFLVGSADESSSLEMQGAFHKVILFASSFAVLIGVLIIRFFMASTDSIENSFIQEPLNSYWAVMKQPSVLLLMIIILTAYVGYKSTDFISQYANVVLDYNEADSAKIGAMFLYLRPIVAISIGLLADRSKGTFWVSIGFSAAVIGAMVFATNSAEFALEGVFLSSTILLGFGVYATRALYFSLLKEGYISLAITGVAVSVISVVGYLPDIFMGPLTGYYLDKYPGELGFQWVFGILAVFSCIGLIATLFFSRINKKII